MKTPCETILRSAPADLPYREDGRLWILAATILASSMAFIDSTAVNVALPALQKSLHATVVEIQWVVESYGLFLGALILVGGTLGDVFGRRRIFVAGTILFALASLGCAISLNIQTLILAQSVQGVGAALLVPGSLAMISTAFDEQSRGQAIGTWSGWSAITMAVGPVLGGWLAEHASWRWVFVINLPFAAVVTAISMWRIPERRSTTESAVDWWGALLATAGLGGLVFGLIESTSLGWNNPIVFGSLIAGLACLVTFASLEARSASPMIPLALFRKLSFSGPNILTLFFYAALGILFFLLPLNLIQVQGYSATAAGAAILPMILLVFLLSRWSGGLVASYGPRNPLIAGSLIAALGFMLFAVPSFPAVYWKTFFPAVTILGLGMAITVAPLTTDVMNSVDQDHVGTASGINSAVARVAGVLGIAVFGIMMIWAFQTRLNSALNRLSLAPGILHEIHAQESRLDGLQPPAGLDAPNRAGITDVIRHSFVFGFRIVMTVCAALALASAAVARLLIPSAEDRSGRAP